MACLFSVVVTLANLRNAGDILLTHFTID